MREFLFRWRRGRLAGALLMALAATLLGASCARYVGADDKPVLSVETLAQFDRYEMRWPRVYARLVSIPAEEPIIPAVAEKLFLAKKSSSPETRCQLLLDFRTEEVFWVDQPFEGPRQRVEYYVEWDGFYDGALGKLWLVAPSATLGAVLLVIGSATIQPLWFWLILPVGLPVAITLPNPLDIVWRLGGVSGADILNDLISQGYLEGPGGASAPPFNPLERPGYGQRLLDWTAWINPFQAQIGPFQAREMVSYAGPIESLQRNGFPEAKSVRVGFHSATTQRVEWVEAQKLYPVGDWRTRRAQPSPIVLEGDFFPDELPNQASLQCVIEGVAAPDLSRPFQVEVSVETLGGRLKRVYGASLTFKEPTLPADADNETPDAENKTPFPPFSDGKARLVLLRDSSQPEAPLDAPKRPSER
jgi:hypothetical protein